MNVTDKDPLGLSTLFADVSQWLDGNVEDVQSRSVADETLTDIAKVRLGDDTLSQKQPEECGQHHESDHGKL